MKINRKLSVGIFSVLVLACAVALTIQYRLMIRGQEEELAFLGGTVGQVVEESLVYSMMSRDAGLLQKTIRDLKKAGPILRILLLNNEERVMAGTEAGATGRSLSLLDARAESDTAGGRETTFRWIQGVRNREECHRCHSPNAKYNGSIIIDFSMEQQKAKVGAQIRSESLLLLASFSTVGIAAFLLSNSIVILRLNRAIDAMKRFKNGEETVRMPVEGRDEIAKLCSGFNEMADAVSNSQAELKQYASELLALAVSSHVVTAVPRTENLYEAVCNIAVRELRLTMAWIGLVRPNSFEVEPVAQNGFEDGYLATITVRWDDTEAGRGPTGTAIRKKTPQVINDITTEPLYHMWREEAVRRGYRSSMALPLLSSAGDLLGVLNLYSGQTGHFTRKRVRMFMIFANQVSTEIENRALIENAEISRAELGKQFEIVSRSQKEWQMTFDSITDMVSIHDRQFRIIKANKAVAEHFGIPPSALVNRHCHDVFHDSCAVPMNCPHAVSMRSRETVTEEVRDPKSGKLFRVSTFPYYSDQGEFAGSVHVARDITREKETELRLIMSERLASLGQMASGLAHEINTPLASIAGCAEGLLMKVRNGRYDPQLFEEYLQIVEEEIQRCKNITTGMLSFVRTSTYDMKDVSINEAIDRTVEIIGFQGRLQDVVIERRYQAQLPLVHGSEGELRQVFLAIMVNALDAMEDRGTLTLETAHDNDFVLIRFTDTGPGIEPENRARIFDPFFTTKSEKGGTGLGLSIAYKIITNHNGTIDAEPGEGCGTTFTIRLPAPAAGSEQIPTALVTAKDR